MQRSGWAVLVLFACGGPPPPPAPSGGPAPAPLAMEAPADAAPAQATVPRVGSGPSGCLTPDEVVAEQQRVTASNEAAFATAVTAAGLAIELLPIHTWQADQMAPPPANPIVKRSIRGRDVTLVLLGTIGGGCGPLQAEHFPFGRAADAIYRLERHVTHRTVVVSACPRQTCPQPTIVCGGAMRVTGIGFEVPPGTRYAGEKTIGYQEEHLDVRFDQGVGVHCVAPPPPP